MDEKDVRDLKLEEIRTILEAWGEASYRAGQIFDWLYKKDADSFDLFTDLPKNLRQKLKENFLLRPLTLAEHLTSSDKTEKFLFRLADGHFIESVLIPAGARQTLCLSTQVGCKFACVFCASGKMGFKRNLRPSEIVGQILFLRDKLRVHLTNFVFMGMGEPLDNYDHVVKAVQIMNDPQALGIAARRITVSTAGVVPGIERLKGLGLQINLSLSLHAAKDELRTRLLPINKKYPLEKVLQACRDYGQKTGRRTTLEYVLLRGLNDSTGDARRLAALAKRLRAKVNLIPCSVFGGSSFEPSSEREKEIFLRILEDEGVKATLRSSKGSDIQAACGQLAGRAQEKAVSG